MGTKTINLTLKIWRQNGPEAAGLFETHEAKGISTAMSFLEMLDVINNELERQGKEPIVFDHDCREGICGTCGAVINGAAHGPQRATTLCQLHMRQFEDGQTLVIEPFRAKAFPILKDLAVGRSAFDRIIQAGGYISVKTGEAPSANVIPVPRGKAETAMDAASCVGCGACVAACPNASANLFTSARVAHLSRLPQGHPERRRAVTMLQQTQTEGFGSCSKRYECEAACPKEVKVSNISILNREFLMALLTGEERPAVEIKHRGAHQGPPFDTTE